MRMMKLVPSHMILCSPTRWSQLRTLHRLLSESKNTTASPPKLKHVVYVSQSKCIYENLALEDWLYEKSNLEEGNYLLMWRNKPAVVIGRHQNVWLECDVGRAARGQVDLARRKSGGGAVYHDEGNVNLSFIKARQRYCRRENLELVVRALQSQWDVDLSINKREDILLDGLFKISGTASKLGGKRTYHHFTLLLDVDTEKLNSLLNSPMRGVKSNSTESVPAHVRNLRDSDPSLNFTSLVQRVGEEFLSADTAQPSPSIEMIDSITDDRFPGVSEKISELHDWQWIFAKTPPFSIHKSTSTSINDISVDLNINIDIVKGRVNKIDSNVSSNGIRQNLEYLVLLSDKLGGVRLDREELLPLLTTLTNEISTSVPERDLTLACWVLKCAEEMLIC